MSNHTGTGMTDAAVCGYCGVGHVGACPRVKAIEYHPNGTVKRVEFHEPQQVTHTMISADDLHALKAR